MSVHRLTSKIAMALCALLGALLLSSAPALAAAPEAPELKVGVPVPATTAMLHGVLNPLKAGEAGIYEFLYKQGKAGCAGGGKAPEPPGLMTGIEHEEVSQELSGLTANTEYTVCLRAEETTSLPHEEAISSAVTFKTALPPETPETTSPANPIAATTATLHGVVNPKAAGNAGSYEFLYRASATECVEGDATPAASALGGAKEAVFTEATELQPATQYTFCLLARNEAGETALGAPVTFTTLAAPPIILSEATALPVKASEATLEAQINSNNQKTTYSFQYSTEATGETLEGTITTLNGAGALSGFGPQTASVAATGLAADTPYHYRVIAENQQSKTEVKPAKGKVQSFTTAISPETPETLKTEPIAATTATLHGVLNPKAAGNPGTYEFLYRASATECTGGEKSSGSATGTMAEKVEAKLTGLLPYTSYTFCLLARNEAGEEALSAPVTFTTLPLPPVVEGESAPEVEATEAVLTAQINPEGQATTYHVEYGTSEAYGQSTRETSAGAAGFAAASVQLRLSGLQPGSTYHYRFVATNASHETTRDEEGRTFTTPALPLPPGSEHCPNEASRQGPSAGLPDCRVYEQVTPVNKGGGVDLFANTGFGGTGYETRDSGVVSEDGNHFLLSTLAAIGANAASGNDDYVFSRGAGGWTMTPLVAPGLGVQGIEGVPVFDPATLSKVGVLDLTGALPELFTGNLEGVKWVNLLGPVGGPYTIVSSTPAISGEQVFMAGASTDLSHVVLESTNHQLAPGVAGQTGGSMALYELVGGQLRVVNVATDGSLVSQCGAILGQGNQESGTGVNGVSHNAVSGDGSKIFFTAPDPRGVNQGVGGPGCWERETSPQVNPPQLYMRVGGARTVDVSAPAPGVVDPNGLQLAVYVGASVDGSKVFFVTKTELTAGNTTHDPELYEYDTNAGVLTCISCGAAGTADGNVDFVPAVSSDGSTVYFTAFGQLAPGAATIARGVNGLVNLYRYDTRTETTTYVTAVGNEDYPLAPGLYGGWYNEGPFGLGQGLAGVFEIGPEARANWYTTGDGRYLVFATYQPVTGYDSTNAPGHECAFLLPQVPRTNCTEVYRYDAASGSIVCVSCGPRGVTQFDNAEFARSAYELSASGVPPRPVSEDGSRVFFDTANALVPQAVPGRVHVYEWHDGTLSLISSASDPGNAFFLGSSADGRDVFIGAHAQLAPGDTDGSGDLYDARAGGGFVGQSPPACTGTGCQGIPAPAPLFATPASETFQGAGNLPASQPLPKARSKPAAKPKRCRRGYLKRHGRCVKQRAKKPAKGRK